MLLLFVAHSGAVSHITLIFWLKVTYNLEFSHLQNQKRALVFINLYICISVAGAHGVEEGGEGAGVKEQMVPAGVSPEVAAAHPRGGGAVLQHQEAER